ncbi:glycosyltransferase WbuB [Candidatus Saccharibacteria bacterium CPR2]|nr:glycosyltransferase WbuB [Candidatus Saccharibacteria bacterium CPR2]
MASKNNPKKILIVTQHFWPENFRVNDISDFLIEKNCEIEVLCGIPNYPKGQFFDDYSWFKNRRQTHKGIKIRRAFEIPRGSNTNFRVFINYVSFPLASLFHIPRLLTKKYDRIFIAQYSPVLMGIAGILVGKIKKIDTTMYVFDLWPENLFSVLPVKNKFLCDLATKVSHWHYKKVNKLVALSERMKNHLQEITKLPDNKIMVLPQVCEKLYEQDIEDKDLAKRFKNGFNILFTGSITPAQSFETIINAAKLLKKDGIDDINWIIVGDGMSRKWLEGEVKKAGLWDSFYFEGMKPMEDIPRYTTMADLLVGCLVKSDLLEATIPAKVMSYFAAGRPMVLAMDGEVRDLVNNTVKCGLAGPTEDFKSLAENIKKIHALSKTEREKMGQRGRAYHFKHFERNMNLQKLYDFTFS